jgi:hypothetical protein
VRDWLEDNEVTDEQQKIRLAAAYLKKGDAAEWSTQQAEDGVKWPTYDVFLKAVQDRFGDIDPKYTARQKLMKTRQVSSVEAYNTEFKKHSRKTGFSDEDLSDKYQRGLNERILQSIYQSGALPNKLDEWFERALHFDRMYEQFQRLRPGVRGMTSERTKAPIAEPQQTKPRVRAEDYTPGTTGPMDIDTARRENKCRHCRQPWEVNHNCERKKAAQAAYQERASGRRREERMETDAELVAKLKDELDATRKKLEEAKEEGD